MRILRRGLIPRLGGGPGSIGFDDAYYDDLGSGRRFYTDGIHEHIIFQSALFHHVHATRFHYSARFTPGASLLQNP